MNDLIWGIIIPAIIVSVVICIYIVGMRVQHRVEKRSVAEIYRMQQEEDRSKIKREKESGRNENHSVFGDVLKTGIEAGRDIWLQKELGQQQKHIQQEKREQNEKNKRCKFCNNDFQADRYGNCTSCGAPR